MAFKLSCLIKFLKEMRLVVVWHDEKFIVSTLNTNSRKMNLPFECNKRWPGFKAVPADFLSKVPN